MIKILPFNDTNKEHIKILNYEWLQKYFFVEENDVLQLSNPQEEIIEKGGKIYYATLNEEIVGTSTLMKVSETEYELAKMAVTQKAQGVGIGKILLEHCIHEAKNMGAKKLSLFSNTKLAAAIKLYVNYGFIETELPAHIHYERANIKMEKKL